MMDLYYQIDNDNALNDLIEVLTMLKDEMHEMNDDMEKELEYGED